MGRRSAEKDNVGWWREGNRNEALHHTPRTDGLECGGQNPGPSDIPMNRPRRRLAKGMERPVTAIYSSPQRRALETARAIADSQKVQVFPASRSWWRSAMANGEGGPARHSHHGPGAV